MSWADSITAGGVTSGLAGGADSAESSSDELQLASVATPSMQATT
jgi:hypothetical protein